MVKRIIVVVVIVALLLFATVGLILPKSFKISRTVNIQANQMRVIRCINTLDRWESWWPWNRNETGHRLQIHAPANIGANMSWGGRPAPGRLVLTQTSIFAVEYDVHFNANTRPDKGSFTIRASEQGTELTWRVDGHFESPVIGGYLALLADAMHGGMIEWGLNNIKDLAEADKSEINLYYEDELGHEIEEKVD